MPFRREQIVSLYALHSHEGIDAGATLASGEVPGMQVAAELNVSLARASIAQTVSAQFNFAEWQLPVARSLKQLFAFAAASCNLHAVGHWRRHGAVSCWDRL